jgi:DNA repair exonuclease SbcCD ATPase subunit
MADTNTQATEGTNTPAGEGTTQTGAAAQSGQQPTPKTFTQEEVNAIVERRVARVKATPPADYEDLKAKAARLDELEQANKSELEKATDAANAAKARAEELQQRLDALQAESDRAREIRDMAAQYGVSADMLSRMSGDVEDNAKYLKQLEDARPKFGDMRDGGDQRPAGQTLDEIRAIKNPQDRIRARAEYHANHRD